MVTPFRSQHTAALVLAGGSGERFGGLKQFSQIRGKSILFHVTDRLLGLKIASTMVVIVPTERVAQVRRRYASTRRVFVVAGGRSRYESTKIGLAFLVGMENSKIRNVFIHDGVRPIVSRKNFLDLFAALEAERSQGAVLYLPVNDSLIEFQRSFHENVYLDRSKIFCLQTPHLYRLNELWDCFSQYQGKEVENAQLMELCGKRLSYVLGSRENIKLTFSDDMIAIKKLLPI